MYTYAIYSCLYNYFIFLYVSEIFHAFQFIIELISSRESIEPINSIIPIILKFSYLFYTIIIFNFTYPIGD